MAASLVAQWEREIHEILFKDELGEELSKDYRGYSSHALVRQILNGLEQLRVDDINTSDKKTLNEAVLPWSKLLPSFLTLMEPIGRRGGWQNTNPTHETSFGLDPRFGSLVQCRTFSSIWLQEYPSKSLFKPT